MKKLILLISCIVALKSNAQISILNTDLAQVNDTVRYSTSSSSINFEPTGADFTWDFSNLIPDNQDVQKYYSPLNTPYVLQFLSSSYGIPEQNALGQMAGIASDFYAFYKNTSAASVLVGRGATVQSLPIGLVYSPRDTIYKFPMTYQKTFSGSFYGTAGFSGIGTLTQAGFRTTEVDGWGNITTPYGTFACIRVKSVITETDTVNIGGFPMAIPNNRTEYTWLAKSQKYPILKVEVNTLTNLVTSIQYKDIYRPELFINNANFSANRTGGSIGDTITFQDRSVGLPTDYTWTITPNTFSYAAGSTNKSQNPQVIFNSNGKYNVKLAVKYQGGQDDTIRSEYITISPAVAVDFTVNNQYPALNEKVYLTDKTTNNPTSWVWTFTPASGMTFEEGTTYISQNPVVTFAIKGNYTVKLRASNGASTATVSKVSYIQVWPTGTSEMAGENRSISYYPNPATNQVTIENHSSASVKINLLSISGQIISNAVSPASGAATIQTDELKAGVYLLQFDFGDSVRVEKLIVK